MDEDTGPETQCPACGGPLPPDRLVCLSCEQTLPPADSPAGISELAELPGRIGSYRIDRHIGRGGMGAVYEAYDEKMRRSVAVKILAPHLVGAGHAADRFAREAWIAGKLSHPNLVKVLDRGEMDGYSYYTMELIDGFSLSELLDRLRNHGGDDSLNLRFRSHAYIRWVISHISEAARGLHHAHERGVVHRDIKPANILYDRTSKSVKVTDFGLALDVEQSRLTTTGNLFGTVPYMAPEQLKPKDDTVGAGTDIYALGVTLFELLTLELPYTPESMRQYMNDIVSAEPRRLRRLNQRIGRDLEVVVLKAIEKRPQDRYPTATAFSDDLENVEKHRPIRAQPSGALARLGKWTRRRPVHAMLAATILVALSVIAALSARAIQQRAELKLTRLERLRDSASLLLQQNLVIEAISKLEQVIEAEPGDVAAQRDLALALTRMANQPLQGGSAGQALERALAVADRLQGTLPGKGWPHRLRAFLLQRDGRHADAELEAAKARSIEGAEVSDLDLELDGMVAMQLGEFQNAVEVFSSMISRRPEASGPRLRRGEANEALGRVDEATRDYEAVVRLAPGRAVGHLSLARLLMSRGELESADAHLETARGIGEDSITYEFLSDHRIRRGHQLLNAGDREGALASYREAEAAAQRSLALGPDSPWALMNLGASLLEQNRLVKPSSAALLSSASEALGRALAGCETRGMDESNPACLDVLANLCDAQLQAGASLRARETCARSARLSPEDPVAFYNLAASYAQAGQTADALTALEQNFVLGDRDDQYLARDPWFAVLRDDPRFLDLLDRMRAGRAQEEH